PAGHAAPPAGEVRLITPDPLSALIVAESPSYPLKLKWVTSSADTGCEISTANRTRRSLRQIMRCVRLEALQRNSHARDSCARNIASKRKLRLQFLRKILTLR